MARRNILDIIRGIKKILKKEQELSVKSISERVGSQWETTIKALEFLKEFNLVKERKGQETYKIERLFSWK